MDADSDDEYERLRRSNSADGYTGSGFGVNQNADLGAMRTPHGPASSGSPWIAVVSLICAIAVITLIVIFAA